MPLGFQVMSNLEKNELEELKETVLNLSATVVSLQGAVSSLEGALITLQNEVALHGTRLDDIEDSS